MTREAELLEDARRYSFRARMDKGDPTGPIFARGSGSEVEDIDGRRYLDFNSGQMRDGDNLTPGVVVIQITGRTSYAVV
jgi:4-aminobutyrate aminotransferase-like enzyme